MKKLILITTLLVSTLAFSQEKLVTRTGEVSFSSETAIENIYAKNSQTASILIPEDGTIAFNILLKSFKFKKALMEEHFNEKYVHSDKYPSAKFKGTIDNDIDLKEPKAHKNVPITGEMILHGVTKPLNVIADILVNENGTIAFTSEFKLVLEDYKIEVPSLVKDKISPEILVSVSTNYKK